MAESDPHFSMQTAQEPTPALDADGKLGKREGREAFVSAPAPIPTFKSDEVGRLRALERLDILDSAPEKPFEAIVDLVRQVLNVPICAVSLVDGDRQWFKAFRGLSVTETSREISFCTHAIMSTRPLLVEDASLDPLFAQNQLVTDDPHIRSYAGIPLTSPDGYNIGTLCAIDIEPRHFSAQEVAILSNFAKIVMDEIELRQIASTDVLTGIMSRRAWLACADKEMHRFDRYGSALSFLIIDIDHFKSINDRFGHAVGDQIIKMVIQSVATQLRQTDCIGRYGGDEFVIALPETRAADAKSLGKRICTSVEAQRFACLGDGSCTVSIGVTGVGAGETNLGLALQRADQAHYRAKRHGRNQVNVIIQLPRVPKRVSQH